MLAAFYIIVFILYFFFLLKLKSALLKDIFILYSFMVFVFFTSFFRFGPELFFFFMIFPCVLMVLYKDLQGIILLILMYFYSVFFLKNMFLLGFLTFIYTLFGLLGLWLFNSKKFHKKLPEFGTGKETLKIETEVSYEKILKNMNIAIRKQIQLFNNIDPECLVFYYNLDRDNIKHIVSSDPKMLFDSYPYKNSEMFKSLIAEKKIFIQETAGDFHLGIFKERLDIKGFILKPVIADHRVRGIIGYVTSSAENFQKYKETVDLFLENIIIRIIEGSSFKKMLKEKNEFSFFYNSLAVLLRTQEIFEISDVLYKLLCNLFPLANFNFIEFENDRYKIIHTISKTAIPMKWFSIEKNHILNSIAKKKDMSVVKLTDGKKVNLNISGSVESHYNSSYLVAIPINTKIEKTYVVFVEIDRGVEISENEKNMLDILMDNIKIIIENRALIEKFTALANIDGLTGIYNHKKFHQIFDEKLTEALPHRGNKEFCVLMIDIDHFKKFNDVYGHQTGDLVLKRVARVLSASTKENDIVARYGGEEFILLMENCNLAKGIDIGERIRRNVEETRIEMKNEVLKITVSIGVSHFPSMGLEKPVLIEKADKGLYKAKDKGRNQVAII